MGAQVQIVSDVHASPGWRGDRRPGEEALEEGQGLCPVAPRR